jgi:hypothetical protein
MSEDGEMTKDHHKSARVGVYECRLDGSFISKGKWVKGYYGLLPLAELLGANPLHARIIGDLKDAKRRGEDFEFPVLVVSYHLGSGDPPKPLPRPPGKLTVKSAGGLIRLRRMMGIPVRRKKIVKTETWEAVIDAEGRVLEVEDCRLKGP